MRVYAESNFVLELALEQEQHTECEALVQLAADRTIELALPAYALLEPYQTLMRRRRDVHDLQLKLAAQEKQLERTASITAEAPRLREAGDLLLRATQDAASRFIDVRRALLKMARIIPVDGSALGEAEALAVDLGLELPDAVMLASVLADATARPSPSIFLNRNTKDFGDPDIKDRLARVDCTLIWKFSDGLARIISGLGKTDHTAL